MTFAVAAGSEIPGVLQGWRASQNKVGAQAGWWILNLIVLRCMIMYVQIDRYAAGMGRIVVAAVVGMQEWRLLR